jgi:hypothetical protein
MNAPSLAKNQWGELHYKVRVRPTPTNAPHQSIWGSALLNQDITFPKPLILHISNDLFGEKITFGTQVTSGINDKPTQTELGSLKPGECISIPIQGCSGVFAYPEDVESTVYCFIKESA